MNHEPLGFWGRLFEYVCNRLADMVEGAAVEQERKDVPPGTGHAYTRIDTTKEG